MQRNVLIKVHLKEDENGGIFALGDRSRFYLCVDLFLP